MSQRDIIQAESRLHRPGNPMPVIMGIDLGSKSGTAFAIVSAKGISLHVDRAEFNARNARRKPDRNAVADVLEAIAHRFDTIIQRKEAGRHVGFHSGEVSLRFALNGVGAMIDIHDLHGGKAGLISWYNTEHPARNFTTRFSSAVGAYGNLRPHHKATSCPSDWYSLAMMLDAGLCLAARGEAFEPVAA